MGDNLCFFILLFSYIFFHLKNFDILKFKKEINLILKNLFKKYAVFIFIFFYLFLWKLDQVAGFRLEGKPNGIFKSSLFAEFVKLIKFIYSYIDLNIIDLPEIKL